ncbi:MAG: aquaporin family protein [Verrucomicrobiaceae bacterium]|nr:aquaporin family protein [Verrucomicrobiaceae bacterium]
MSPFLAELVGTALLILLGNGVVANVVLSRSKGEGSGWIVIAAGWGMAVALAVYAVGTISGAHINPAVTLAMLALGQIGSGVAAGYMLAQMLGAMLGAVLVYLAYYPHWRVTEDAACKRAAFCTTPAIRHTPGNLIAEVLGAFVLVLGALTLPRPENLPVATGFSTGLGPLLVGLVVFSIGLSLGGPTGYAINPARDLGPRIVHFLLPIPGKGSSDWRYAWIPVIGPLVGGMLGAWAYQALW